MWPNWSRAQDGDSEKNTSDNRPATLANSGPAVSHLQDAGLLPEYGKVIKVMLGLNWFTASHVEETVEELRDEILTDATMQHKTLTHISICNADQSCRKHTTVPVCFKGDAAPVHGSGCSGLKPQAQVSEQAIGL